LTEVWLLVPVRNNHRVEHILCGTGITLPPGQWTGVPAEVAFRFSKDPYLTFDWDTLKEQAIDWEGDKRHITVVTPINPSEGYGLGGCTIIRALDMAGVIPHLDRSNSPFRDVVSKKYPAVAAAIDREQPVTRWGIGHTWPPDFGVVNTAHRIGWSMWEATTLPRSWLPHLSLIDRLIVPTKGQVEVFRPDFKGPIDVIPYGIEFENWTAIDRPERDTFTFVLWGRLSARKCPIELVECFWKAFGGDRDPNHVKDVRLILKTRQGDLGTGQIRYRINDPRITVIDAEWDVSQMVQLAHDADCGVFLSHGEGFGLPAVQAMATGLPVILSDHSGQSEFANSRYNYPVGLDPHTPYTLSPLGKGTGGENLDWWEPDYQQAVETMRHVYHNREEAKKKGAKAASWVRKKFSLEKMSEKLGEYIKRLD
jgi:glycosyltransferase involved in cell wall biosynthesis